MPIIQLPDGRTVQFPDGMSPDQIKAALDQQFGPPPEKPKPPAPYFGSAENDAKLSAAGFDPRTHQPGYGAQDQAMQGMTFGLSDEALAGVASLLPGSGSYSDELGKVRRGLKEYAEDHPTRAVVANVTGGVVGGAPGAGTIARLAKGAGPAGRIAANAGYGGALGAATGFGSGEGGLGDRLSSAVKGSVLGTLIGGATAGGAELASRYGGPVLTRIKSLLGIDIPDRDAQKIAQAFERDQVTPEEAAQRLTQAREQYPNAPINLADVMGPESETGKLLRTARDIAGPGGSQIDRTLAERDLGIGQRGPQDLFVEPGTGATNRITDRLNEMSGGNALKATGDIITARDQAATRNYQALRDQAPPIPAGDLGDLWSRPSFKAALKKVQSEHMDLGEESIAPYVDFDAAGEPIQVKGGLPFSVINRVKQVLDDQIYNGPRAAVDVRPLKAVRRALVQKADEFWPSYAETRAQFSGPTRSAEAIEQGQGYLTRRPEENAALIRELEPEDRDLFKMGVYQGLVDKVENAPQGANEVLRLIGSRRSQQQLQAIFSPEEMDQLANMFGWENRMYGTKAQMAGSQTAPRAQRMADFGTDVAMPMVEGLTSGSTTRAMLGTIARLGRQAAGRGIEGLNATTAGRIGEALTAADPAVQENILARLAALPEARKEALARQLMRRGLWTGGVTVPVAATAGGN